MYIKRNVTVPLLDEFAGRMNQRFSAHQQIAALGLSLVPSVFIADPSSARAAIRRFAEEYREDMPATFVDGGSLDAELHLVFCNFCTHLSS